MLEEHLGYVVDSIRLDAFRAAISRFVRPGDRVVDLGCGSGILGLMCLQAGASRVFAIDSTAMIEVARETLTRAGLADRTTFIRGHSNRVELPEPVDLVICDQVGHFGFDYGIVQTLQDARRRFLGPEGRVVPRTIQLHVGAGQLRKAIGELLQRGVLGQSGQVDLPQQLLAERMTAQELRTGAERRSQQR